MTKTRRLLTALSVTGLTMAPLGTADAFFGFWPGSWFGPSPYGVRDTGRPLVDTVIRGL